MAYHKGTISAKFYFDASLTVDIYVRNKSFESLISAKLWHFIEFRLTMFFGRGNSQIPPIYNNLGAKEYVF